MASFSRVSREFYWFSEDRRHNSVSWCVSYFQFVPIGRSGALFVGAYCILDEWVFPTDPLQHALHDPAFVENDDHEHLRYNL